MTKIDPNNVPEGAVALPLSDGSYTLVDADVADALQGARLIRDNKGYVRTSVRGAWVFLHQIVVGIAPGCDTHHRNAQPDDNRRENLVHLARGDHMRLEPAHRRRDAEFNSVRFSKSKARFVITLTVQRKQQVGLLFGDPLLAALCRDDYLDRTGILALRDFDRRVSPLEALALLQSTAGRFFTIWFVKRSDGRIRRMTCRLRGQPHPAGLKFDPHDRALLPVWDLQAREWRFVNLEGVLCVRTDGKSYRVDHRRAVAA
jgi:hypothetical protein